MRNSPSGHLKEWPGPFPSSTMTLRIELSIGYDRDMSPVSGYCTRCGEMMPKPPQGLRSSSEIVTWLAQQFMQHKQLKHSQPNTEETK
jgi:hypothetical protein